MWDILTRDHRGWQLHYCGTSFPMHPSHNIARIATDQACEQYHLFRMTCQSMYHILSNNWTLFQEKSVREIAQVRMIVKMVSNADCHFQCCAWMRSQSSSKRATAVTIFCSKYTPSRRLPTLTLGIARRQATSTIPSLYRSYIPACLYRIQTKMREPVSSYPRKCTVCKIYDSSVSREAYEHT